MKKIINIVIILVSISSFSQVTLVKSSVDSGGASVTNGTISILYTIGEVNVQETTVGSLHISEGFIGPDIQAGLDIQDYTNLAGVKVFPNPATDYITISFSEEANYNIAVFDQLGKQIKEINTGQTSTQSINMQNYSRGIYLVLVKNTVKQQYVSYKVVKK